MNLLREELKNRVIFRENGNKYLNLMSIFRENGNKYLNLMSIEKKLHTLCL